MEPMCKGTILISAYSPNYGRIPGIRIRVQGFWGFGEYIRVRGCRGVGFRHFAVWSCGYRGLGFREKSIPFNPII